MQKSAVLFRALFRAQTKRECEGLQNLCEYSPFIQGGENFIDIYLPSLPEKEEVCKEKSWLF